MQHNLVCGDFLLTAFRDETGCPVRFDHVVGNPPFGGTINEQHQDELDRCFGFRNGVKIKKETYSFFVVKCVDELRRGGHLTFICSDTFMTIKTMKGLRDFLHRQGRVFVNNLAFFSDEVSQQTVLLRCIKNPDTPSMLVVNGRDVAMDDILATPNHSWRMRCEWTKHFRGGKIGDIMIASSGMTVGKNDLFVRTIRNGKIMEPYEFAFYHRPVTLADELQKARLHKLSPAKTHQIQQMETNGETARDVRITKRPQPLLVDLPHPDYCYYNKARKGAIYAPPQHAIFWRDDGDAVYTYKRNGNWYLRGVGGKKYFFREGLTWNLVSSRLRMRWLPPGCVLDSGAPCAFLKAGTPHDELFFVLAWSVSDLCNAILKNVINHTKNIQGKDVERLPYPFWVPAEKKAEAVRIAKNMLAQMQQGEPHSNHDIDICRLNAIFADGDFADFPAPSPAVDLFAALPRAG